MEDHFRVQDGAWRSLAALKALLDQGENPSLNEWAERACVTYSTICKHRDRLLYAGLLSDQPGRVRSVRITDTGREALEAREARRE